MIMSTTPVPLPYVQMAKIFTLVFLLTLPAALVDDLGWHTVTATFVLSLGYLGLDAIGKRTPKCKLGFDHARVLCLGASALFLRLALFRASKTFF